jgi:hypothetical protein
MLVHLHIISEFSDEDYPVQVFCREDNTSWENSRVGTILCVYEEDERLQDIDVSALKTVVKYVLNTCQPLTPSENIC